MQALKSIFAENRRPRIFFILGLFLIFFIGLKAPTDPDFGWHLRNGWEILANRSIPHFDPYSFTMSNFPWISYSWLSDVFAALIEKFFGLLALSLVFAGLSLIAFLIAAKSFKTEPAYQIIMALMAAILSASVIGVRMQVFTILGLAIFLFILLRWRENQKIYPEQSRRILYWLPILFFLWANIHAGFAIGLVLFFIFIIIKAISTIVKIVPESLTLKNLSIAFLLSVAATFINPYGLKIYEEIFRTATDFYGRSLIIEWQSLFAAPVSVLIPVLIFAVFLFGSLFFQKKRDWILINTSVLFFVLAILAWRNLPLFFVASAPLFVVTLENLTGKQLLKLLTLPIILLALTAITFYLGWRNLKDVWAANTNPAILASQAEFPYRAIKFLKSNHLPLATNHLFNDYNWGGYLLWQLPNQKVFIDGRMPHWQLPDKHIFADYQTLQAAKNLNAVNSLIEKYNLNLALLRSDSPLAFYLSLIGWQKIYGDELAIILKK